MEEKFVNEDKMFNFWPNYEMYGRDNNVAFWAAQLKKHGSRTNLTNEGYFNLALSLAEQLDEDGYFSMNAGSPNRLPPGAYKYSAILNMFQDYKVKVERY